MRPNEAYGQKKSISSTMLHIGKYDKRDNLSTYDLATALQYGQGTGSAQLLGFINEHVQASLLNLLISNYILTDNSR